MNEVSENHASESHAAHAHLHEGGVGGIDSEASETTKTKPAKAKKEKTDDVLVLLVQEISSLSPEDAINAVLLLMDKADENYFRMGGILSIIQTKKMFEAEGFETFKVFVEAKYGIPYRKAMYWIHIYEALVESGVSWNKVKDVGWTKLKDLASILTLENVDEWVERALSSTTLQLQEAIAKHHAGTLQNNGTDPVSAPSEVTTFTVKVHADDKVIIREAIDKAKAVSSTEFDGVALVNICTNFLAGGNATKPMSLVEVLTKYAPEDALLAFEKVYPDIDVTVKVKSKAKKD